MRYLQVAKALLRLCEVVLCVGAQEEGCGLKYLHEHEAQDAGDRDARTRLDTSALTLVCYLNVQVWSWCPSLEPPCPDKLS